MEAAPLAPHYDDADLVDEPEDLSKHTAIQNRYCFWYRQRSVKGGGGGSGGGDDKNTWKEPESVASFQTVQHFWRIYDHLMRPSACPAITDFHLFKHCIKPTWEDPSNRNGGQFITWDALEANRQHGIAAEDLEACCSRGIGKGQCNRSVQQALCE